VRRRAVLAGAAVLAAAGLLRAAASPSFRYERRAVIDAPGPHGLPVDVSLLTGSLPFRVETHAGPDGTVRRRARGGLRDLRLYDAQGREVPYLLVEPPLPAPEWRRAATVLPIPATKKESGFEADLGGAPTVDRLRVLGLPAPFLKRLALDGSGDRRRWTRLAAEATLFDLPDSDLRQLELPFPPGVFRYLRVTWDDASSARVPLPRGIGVRVVRADAPARPAVSATVSFDRRASEPGTSRFRLRLPAPSLPVVALRLALGGAHVLRRARVTETRLAGEGAIPVRLGEATLRRTVHDTLSAEELRIPVEPPTTGQLELVVADGDNRPLEVEAVRAELASCPGSTWRSRAAVRRGALGDPASTPPLRPRVGARAGQRSAPPARTWGSLGARPDRRGAFRRAEAGPSRRRPSATRERSDGPQASSQVPLDAAVLAQRGRLRGDFADLRVVDAAGRQLHYLLERRPEPLVVALPAPTPAGEAAARSGPGTACTG
jgi:hypothetical protein